MNWFKISQQLLQQQYNMLLQQAISNIQIVGTGQSEMLQVPGGKPIVARELLQRVKMRLAPVLIKNKVNKIDTGRIPQANAQGVAISSEPGTIHIDIGKIFDSAKRSLPPTTQMDGVQPDPDVINSIVEKVARWIEGELAETAAHESKHMVDYTNAYQNGTPFTSVQEQPADAFGKQTRNQYMPN